MNMQDSVQMMGLLSKLGYQSTEDPLDADLMLLVTCSIREKAVQKVYSELGRWRPYAEANPNLIVGVSGCVAQQEKGNFFKRFPFLDLVFGPDAIKELPEMVETVLKKKQAGEKERILKTQFHSRKDFEFVNLISSEGENAVKAFVNIQKGCDNVCSFCIVPQVRGREVSRPSSQIVDEIKALVDLGVKEVTLLGQNVNSYGLKDTGEVNFTRLLERIGSETKLERLRFTTSHPKDVGPDLIALFGGMKMLCPSFHLPVQSGSNSILKAMRRYYTREHYLNLIDELRKVRPDITFSTDFIVGFPGETPQDFEDTLTLFDAVKFDMSFAFAYSPRPGTRALSLDDTIPLDEKNRRLDILQTRQRQVARALNERLVGTHQEVLVENADEFGQNWVGRTLTNKIVHMRRSNADRDLAGSTVQVEIKTANPFSLLGEVVHG